MAERLFETYAKQADKFILKNYINNPAFGTTQQGIQELSFQDATQTEERYRSNRTGTDSTRFSNISTRSPINVSSKFRTKSVSGNKKLNNLRRQIRDLSESKL